ncbi:hypothetical protein SAMN05519103_00747 [Rhizobiales bacterium GAS113]|nr:hypothetical protein SAMN05519103_00747 [Rhizobiales bacterium GAS113]
MITARFKPISNQSDWSTTILFNDKASDTPIDFTGLTWTLQLQLQGDINNVALLGSTATGELTNPSLGILQVYFPVTRMKALTAGSYRLGLTVTNGIYTTQVMLGLVPIVPGIVGQTPGPNWDYS